LGMMIDTDAEFRRFLQADTPWGFAVNIAPYNDEVNTFLFGDGDNAGKLFTLFQTDHAVLSMQFEPVESPESSGQHVSPTVYYTLRNQDSGDICQQWVWSRNSEDWVPQRDTLQQGFQMVLTAGFNGMGPTLKLRDKANNFYTIFEDLSFELDTQESPCLGELIGNTNNWRFGQGAVLNLNGEEQVHHHLRARVDDLALLKFRNSGFTFDTVTGSGVPGLTSTEHYLADSFFDQYDFLPNDNSDDGFAWYPFYARSAQQQPNQVADASGQWTSPAFPALGGLCRIDQWNVLDCQPDTVEKMQWIQDHYRTSNNATFEAGMWLNDIDQPTSVFDDNAQFMSDSHLIFDGNMFLQHESQPGLAYPLVGLGSSVPLLSLTQDWAFAFKWAPDSQETSDMMFGGTDGTGTETTLLYIGNHIFTMQFPRQQNQVHPTFRWRTRGNDSSSMPVVCRSIEMETLPANGLMVGDLEMGMWVSVHYQAVSSGGSPTMEIWVNDIQVFSDTINTAPISGDVECSDNDWTSNTPPYVEIGSEVLVGSETFAGLRGRFDDFTIFHATQDSFVMPYSAFANAGWGDMNASSTGTGPDNVLWWNFGHTFPENQVIEAGINANDEEESQLFSFYMMINNNGNFSAVSTSDASQYYSP